MGGSGEGCEAQAMQKVGQEKWEEGQVPAERELQMTASIIAPPTAHEPKLEPNAPPSNQHIHACNPGQAISSTAH